MNITLSYTLPSPPAACGYETRYQRKGESSYSTIVSTGSTAVIPITTGNTGCYYGTVLADCCSSSSAGVEWGVNMYVPVTVSLYTAGTYPSSFYNLTVTIPYPNPYPIFISGTFSENCSGTIRVKSFTYIHPANSLSSSGRIKTGDGIYYINTSCASPSYTQPVIDRTVPAFTYSGAIQQLDATFTPGYCGPYWVTSGVTYIGNPLTLPSFTIDTYTTTSSGGGPTTGVATFSWYHDAYSSGTAPYDSCTIRITEVLDTSVIIGESAPIDIRTSGMKYASVNLLEATTTLDHAALFSMTVVKPDDTNYGFKQVELP